MQVALGAGKGDKGRVRIIAGSAGRVRIRVPAGVVRPTTDFVRQALFSILGEVVVGARVLDLFAGSGALGLEALSRGAAGCVFVDHSARCVAAIRENLSAAGLSGGRVVRSEVEEFLAVEQGSYDMVFADPPYARGVGERDELAEVLGGADLRRVVAAGGWFVAEAPAEREVPVAAGWNMRDRRVYGGSSILLYGAGDGS